LIDGFGDDVGAPDPDFLVVPTGGGSVTHADVQLVEGCRVSGTIRRAGYGSTDLLLLVLRRDFDAALPAWFHADGLKVPAIPAADGSFAVRIRPPAAGKRDTSLRVIDGTSHFEHALPLDPSATALHLDITLARDFCEIASDGPPSAHPGRIEVAGIPPGLTKLHYAFDARPSTLEADGRYHSHFGPQGTLLIADGSLEPETAIDIDSHLEPGHYTVRAKAGGLEGACTFDLRAEGTMWTVRIDLAAAIATAASTATATAISASISETTTPASSTSSTSSTITTDATSPRTPTIAATTTTTATNTTTATSQ
jgi:hypothetical protein